MTKILSVILAYSLCWAQTAKAAETKAPSATNAKVIKNEKPHSAHLEAWEIEILERMQLLENLELLQDMDLFKEDFAVLGVEDKS